MLQENADEVAARQRLGRLSTRAAAGQNSRPSAGGSNTGGSLGIGRQASAPASTSGRHVVPPKLSQDDSWAAQLDDDDSWDSLDQKPAAGSVLIVCWLKLSQV